MLLKFCCHYSRLITLLMCLCMLLFTCKSTESENKKYLIIDGEASAVIVTQAVSWNDVDTVSAENFEMEKAVPNAISELQYHIERATGVRLPVVTMSELDNVPDNYVRVLIGPGQIATSPGLEFDRLHDQGYKIKAMENYLVITGQNPESILWSVYRFVDLYMGARWLWPGEIGTYVPQTKNIMFPADLNIVDHPPLQWRNFNIRPPEYIKDDIAKWLTRHMTGGGNLGTPGDQGDLRVGHSFTRWWDRYGADHPDLFAQSREEYPWRIAGHRLKLCVTNQKVDELIISEWLEAGAPNFWNVGNNDGPGQHCLCSDCLALDKPAGQTLENIWYGARHYYTEANMTARYVAFWMRLLEKMKAINPDVRLGAYAFSDYRYAPPPGTRLDGMVISIVGAYWEYDDWLAWYNTGAEVYLRPNWWHTGGVAPHIPLHAQGNFFKFAWNHGMRGFFMDTLLGYWGAQSPLYYLIARLSYHPDKTVDEIISEYTDAFGSAKEVVRQYLDYWETLTDSARYGIRAGILHPEPGLYEIFSLEHELGEFKGSARQIYWRILPYIYTDEVLAPAYEMLDRARILAANDGEYVLDRIQFLRDSLRYLEVARDVFRLGYPATRPDDSEETWQEYLKAIEALSLLDKEAISPHVVWSTSDFRSNPQFGSPDEIQAWRNLWAR